MKTQNLDSIATRFEKSTTPEEGTSCILWKGSTNSSGYGRFTLGDKKEIAAHRYIWQETNKQVVPEGFALRHLCQNKKCVNPDHIELFDKKTGYSAGLVDEPILEVENEEVLADKLEEMVAEIGAKQAEQVANTVDVKPVFEQEIERVEDAELPEQPKAKEPKAPKAPKEPKAKKEPKAPRVTNIKLELSTEDEFCPHGHLMTGERVYPDGRKSKTCKVCAKAANDRAKAKRLALKEAEAKVTA